MSEDQAKKDDIETGDAAQATAPKEAAKPNSEGKGATTKTTGMTMTEDGGMEAKVGFLKVKVSALRLPLVGMLMSSIVLIVAVWSWTNEWRSNSWEIYAYVYPCVTAGVALLALFMTCKKGFFQNNGKYLSIFLFVWNFTGAALLTFIDPFTSTGNGYFAAWATVASTVGALGMKGNTFKDNVGSLGSVMGLISASIVVIVAIASPDPNLTSPGSSNRWEAIYAMVVACVTMVKFLVYILLRRESSDAVEKPVAGMITTILFIIVAAAWIALPFIVTFRGPFTETGNGYFASWAGMACACAVANERIKKNKAKDAQAKE